MMRYLLIVMMLAGAAWAEDNAALVPQGLCGICSKESPCQKGYETCDEGYCIVSYWCESDVPPNNVLYSPKWYMKKQKISMGILSNRPIGNNVVMPTSEWGK
jgi:hypothetical protein